MRLLKAILAVAATTCLILPALAQEKRIVRSELPPAVEKAIAAQTQGATIRGFTEEKENGHILYETELTVNGHSKDVLMNAKGVVEEVEEQVSIDSLPATVRDAFTSRAGKGKVVKVESLVKHDRLVAYEAQILTKGKKWEAQVDSEGKPLMHHE